MGVRVAKFHAISNALLLGETKRSSRRGEEKTMHRGESKRESQATFFFRQKQTENAVLRSQQAEVAI